MRGLVQPGSVISETVSRKCRRQRKAAAEPAGGRGAKGIEPLVHRIAAEFLDMGRKHRANEGRNGMLWFADRQADGRLAGLRISQKFA